MIFELNATLQDALFELAHQAMDDADEPTEVRLRLRKIRNVLPATQSACIPMTTPRKEALRIQRPIYGEEP
jgi:hypothetical protein